MPLDERNTSSSGDRENRWMWTLRSPAVNGRLALKPYGCGECLPAEPGETSCSACFDRNKARIDSLIEKFGEDAVRLVTVVEAYPRVSWFELDEDTEELDRFLSWASASRQVVEFQTQVMVMAPGHEAEGFALARVSNDHGFVALIMMLGFAGWWP